jgi:hypothetical protein
MVGCWRRQAERQGRWPRVGEGNWDGGLLLPKKGGLSIWRMRLGQLA